jgi:hypothetical protein
MPGEEIAAEIPDDWKIPQFFSRVKQADVRFLVITDHYEQING